MNIIKIRDTFVKELNEIISVIHDKLSGGREHLFLEYEPSVTIESYEEQIKRRREQDIRKGNLKQQQYGTDYRFIDLDWNLIGGTDDFPMVFPCNPMVPGIDIGSKDLPYPACTYEMEESSPRNNRNGNDYRYQSRP